MLVEQAINGNKVDRALATEEPRADRFLLALKMDAIKQLEDLIGLLKGARDKLVDLNEKVGGHLKETIDKANRVIEEHEKRLEKRKRAIISPEDVRG